MKNLQALKRQIVEVGKRMYERGFVAANDGNISARVDDKHVLITPSGVSKGFMKPDDLALIDLNGKVISGTKKPSSEVFMHLQVYKDRADVNSVCHAHPPYATAFAVAGIPLDQCILPEVIITLGSIPLIEYGTPGSEEFYKPVVKLLQDYDAFLLANHGALTVGADILAAYHKMETLEHYAHIAFIARQLGSARSLNKEQVQKLIELRPKFGVRTEAGCVAGEQESTSCSAIPDAASADASKKELIKRVTEEVFRQLGKK